jgi:hypothetical protein
VNELEAMGIAENIFRKVVVEIQHLGMRMALLASRLQGVRRLSLFIRVHFGKIPRSGRGRIARIPGEAGEKIRPMGRATAGR